MNTLTSSPTADPDQGAMTAPGASPSGRPVTPADGSVTSAKAGHDFFFSFLSFLMLFVVTAKFGPNTSPAAVLDTRDPYEFLPEPLVRLLWWVALGAGLVYLARGVWRLCEAASTASGGPQAPARVGTRETREDR